MTFNDIEESWTTADRLPERWDVWEYLCGPTQGWLQACQAAVSAQDTETIAHWLEAITSVETASQTAPSPHAHKVDCLQFAKGFDIAVPVLHAYLLCAQSLLQTGLSGTTRLVSASALESLIDALTAQMPLLQWPRNQWRDMVQSMHPRGTNVPALHTATLTVLLVDDRVQPQKGVRACLKLELRPQGAGRLYPGFPTAFMRCDEDFHTAAHHVCTYLQTADVWPATVDVRWQLTQPDNARPIWFLGGGSLSAALALGLRKVFAAAGSSDGEREVLDKLQLDYCTLTATCTAEGLLGPVAALPQKIDAAGTPPPLSWLLVASTQPDRAHLLASTAKFPRIVTASTLPEAVHTLVKVQHPPNPFRRLQAFSEHDALYFGGREAESQEIVSRVSTTRFVAIVGLSGSGKSSLVFAGVVPQLDPQHWISAACTLRLADSGALAYAPRRLTPRDSAGAPLEEQDLQEAPRSPTPGGEPSLTEHVATLLEGTSTTRLLLIIDQFEELFTHATEDQQRVFVRQLAAVVQGELPCCVLVTMRAEFYAKMLSMPLLARFFAPRIWPMPVMPEDQVLQAMRKPVAAVGFNFASGLDEHIAQELHEAPGALIILELVLDKLFEKRRGALLTYEAYHEIGAVSKVVESHADNVVGQLVDEEQRPKEEVEAQLQEIFGKLVWNDDGTVAQTTRYVARRDAIEGHHQTMVTKLVDKGLLVLDSERVQVAHEALIDYWPLMQKWVAQHGQSLRFQATVQRWDRNQLTRPMLALSFYAAVIGGITRALLARVFGTFLSPPFDNWGSPTVTNAVFQGLVGTLFGSLLIIYFAMPALIGAPGVLRMRTSARLIVPGLLWGVGLFALLYKLAPERSAAWGYLLTGTLWGIGAAVGAYLGDKRGGYTATPLQALGHRCVGGGVGSFGMLLAFVILIGPCLSAVLWGSLATLHAEAMARAWGEVLEQSVSIWAFLGCFYFYIRRVQQQMEERESQGKSRRDLSTGLSSQYQQWVSPLVRRGVASGLLTRQNKGSQG